MPSILVTGSIAYDRIAVFHDRFARHILPDKIHRLNVSFPVERMTVEPGGTGGNIAYNLAIIGETPLLLGAVGDDFVMYESCLKKNGIDICYIKRIPDTLTSHASIMTDMDDNQIASFFEGAGRYAHESSIGNVKEKIELAIVAPNNKKAMLMYAAECRDRKIPFIADPGQAVLALGENDFLKLIKGAIGLIANDYEWELIQGKTKLTISKLLKKVEWLIVTYAEKGSIIHEREREVKVPAYPVRSVVDPTGCGDAYRAGLMYGLKHGYNLKESANLGAYLGARAVEYNGTQNHRINKKEWETFLMSF